MLYLATLHGETLPQSLPTIHDNIPFPFKVKCKASVNTEDIQPGIVICIVGYKLGKYLTSDGKQVSGSDSVWYLHG